MLAKKEQTSNVEEVRAEFDKLASNRGFNARLKKAVTLLYMTAGFPVDTVLDLTHVPKIELLLDVSLKVVSAESNYDFVYKGPARSDDLYVYLVYDRLAGASVGHYDLITNVRGFFSKPHYCTQCDVAYQQNYAHFCKNTRLFWCFACHRAGCAKSDTEATPCKNCGVSIQSESCSSVHISEYCKDWWFCHLCKKRFVRQKVLCEKLGVVRLSTDDEEEMCHSCDHYYCSVCQENVPIEHLCYVKKRKLHPKRQKYLFF